MLKYLKNQINELFYLFSERFIKAPLSWCLHSSHEKVKAFASSVIKNAYEESNTSIPKSTKSKMVGGFQLPIKTRSLSVGSKFCKWK